MGTLPHSSRSASLPPLCHRPASPEWRPRPATVSVSLGRCANRTPRSYCQSRLLEKSAAARPPTDTRCRGISASQVRGLTVGLSLWPSWLQPPPLLLPADRAPAAPARTCCLQAALAPPTPRPTHICPQVLPRLLPPCPRFEAGVRLRGLQEGRHTGRKVSPGSVARRPCSVPRGASTGRHWGRGSGPRLVSWWLHLAHGGQVHRPLGCLHRRTRAPALPALLHHPPVGAAARVHAPPPPPPSAPPEAPVHRGSLTHASPLADPRP